MSSADLPGLENITAGQDPSKPRRRTFGGPSPEAPQPRRSPKGGGGASPPECDRGPGGRVLPGRHLDSCPGSCPGCQPCPRAHCQVCRRAHAETTCPSCLALARLNLALVGELHSHLPAQAWLGRQAWRSRDDLLGGDATVMLAPAAPSWDAGRVIPVTVELPHDPRPPLDVLAYWINRWHGWTHDSRTLPTHDMSWAVDYLNLQLYRIGQSPWMPGLGRDLGAVVHQLENVLHAGDRPDVSTVPCWDCGARLHKIWTDRADRDHWRCPTCGQLYDQGRYERAQHDQLAARGADRYVPLADAAHATGRSEQTIRNWQGLGLIESRRSPSSGRIEVWWPDVRERDLSTPTRRRRGTT